MKKRGFTLIEIMLVVLIISVVMSLLIVDGVKVRAMANESNAQANLKSIAGSFEVYAASHGAYAQSDESNMQFLVDAQCSYQDFVTKNNIGNFRYVVGSINPGGYDIRAMAINSLLAGHNYQITTGGLIKRSDTSGPGDTDFKVY